MTVAKAMSSAYLPISATLVSKPIYEAMLASSRKTGAFAHGFTYAGHPVACAAALANLDIIERERLVDGVRRNAPHFRRALESLAASPRVGEVRSIGLMGAVEIVADRTTRAPFPAESRVPWRIREAALRRGLICRAGAEGVMLCPPLVTTPADIDEIVRILGAAIAEVAGTA
jgi:4-aminobutyrate--pyruvate transaminase